MGEGEGPGGTAWRLAAVVVLVLVNGFFVAAEFGLVAVRRSRVDELAAAGDGSARRVQRALPHLDRYLSGTQLGITLASLALGWIGEPALAGLVDAAFARFGVGPHAAVSHSAAAAAIAFACITFFHIVLGELAPKSLAIAHAEAVSRWVTPPLVLFSRVMRPFIWLLNGAATGLLRLVGVKPASEAGGVHSAAELRMLVTQSEEHGELDTRDSELLASVFDFRDKRARDVMRPRPDVVALALDSTEAEVRAVVRREQYSRYPVYRSTLDDVVGIFLVKDLWLTESERPFSLQALLREPVFVPSTRPAERVLDDLHRSKSQMAVVLDEYAGTAGVLTIEDLIEEIVGDIVDEYDSATRTALEADGKLQLSAALSVIDVRSDYDLAIPEGDWATIGGYVFAGVGRVPRLGDRVQFPNGEFEVAGMEGRRVATVTVYRRQHAPDGSAAHADDDAPEAEATPALRAAAPDALPPPAIERRAARVAS